MNQKTSLDIDLERNELIMDYDDLRKAIKTLNEFCLVRVNCCNCPLYKAVCHRGAYVSPSGYDLDRYDQNVKEIKKIQ